MQRSFLGAWGIGVWVLLSTMAATAASSDRLYQIWQKNYLTDPAVSEKAAADYLSAAPRGRYASELKLWLDAYRTAMANLMAQSKPPGAAPVKQADMPPAPARQPAAKPPETRLASASGQGNPAPKTQMPKEPPQRPPAANPASQSLDEMLAFIADKVASQDRLKFTVEFVNPSSGTLVEQLSYEARDATIDPNRCQIVYRWHVVQDGKAVPDQDRAVQLRLSKSISVETLDQALGESNDNRFGVHARPQAYAVHIARWDNPLGDNLYFRDRGTAEIIAGTARHALDLCDKAAESSRR